MEQRTAKQIQEALAKPFAAGDLEWRLQKAYPQEMRGIAVPYVTNRAIPFGKRKSRCCAMNGTAQIR